uniref:G_PROTEIN_RECEP_F1_2 domain-containing protein n=1 Tax=Strongyloides venezuelensis TaxID=75913 RepID=A0A0K0FTY0_STRVS
MVDSNENDSNVQHEEVIIIGWLSLVTCIIFLVIQITTTLILYVKTEFVRKNSTYIIIIMEGLFYFVQQLIHLFSSLMCIFEFKIDYHFEIIIGSFLNFLYNASIFFGLILTTNRFITFFRISELYSSFVIIFSVITLGSLIGIDIFLFIYYNEEELAIRFNAPYCFWDYKTHYKSTVAFIENRLLIVVNTCSIVLLIFILIKLFLEKYIFGVNIRKINDYEIFLMFRILVNLIFFIILEVLWEYGVLLFPGNLFLYTSINYVFLMFSGKDCIMNLLFLREIKDTLSKKIFAVWSFFK